MKSCAQHNNMKRTLIYFSLLFSLTCLPATAQKQYREIRSLLKENKGADALKKVEALEQDSVLKDDIKRLDYGVEACLKLLDAENMKIYLKQKYDTVGYFKYSYRLYDFLLESDALEGEAYNKKRHSRNQKLLNAYSKNIRSAGNYFFKNKDYKQALCYFDRLVEASESRLGKDVLKLSDKEQARVAYLSLLSMRELKDARGVLKYSEAALNDSAGRRNVRELTSLAYLTIGDTTNYEKELLQGLAEYPRTPFFYSRLSELYLKSARFDDAVALSERMIKGGDDKNIAYWMTNATAMMNLKRYAEAISAGQRALEIDETCHVMNFVVGASYCNLALAIKLPVSIHSVEYDLAVGKQKEYYGNALPYLEKYRAAVPDDAAAWAPLLYRVYLSLNMGRKFSEIEQIMKAI